MVLNGDKLKKLAKEAGVDRAALASAVERKGLVGASAQSAVNNWLDGRNKPTASTGDVAALASAVGAEPKDIVRFVSQVRHHRGSPRKARLVADLIRGKTLEDAEHTLSFSTKRASVNLLKALQAAKADAEALGADERSLVVAESRVDEGPHIKRFQQKDRGRAHPILKRTSHITIGLQEAAAGGAR